MAGRSEQRRQEERRSSGTGAAIPQCAQIPPPPWSSPLRRRVIGNGLTWGYPSSRGCVCAYRRVIPRGAHGASYRHSRGALVPQTNTGELRGNENPKLPRP